MAGMLVLNLVNLFATSLPRILEWAWVFFKRVRGQAWCDSYWMMAWMSNCSGCLCWKEGWQRWLMIR